MTIQEIEELIGDRRVVRHNGQCFITTRSLEDHQRFLELGASERQDTVRGLFYGEIHLWPLLDPMIEENDDGERVDMRRQWMLNYFRERDGYSLSPTLQGS